MKFDGDITSILLDNYSMDEVEEMISNNNVRVINNVESLKEVGYILVKERYENLPNTILNIIDYEEYVRELEYGSEVFIEDFNNKRCIYIML